MIVEKAEISDMEELIDLRLAYLKEDHGDLSTDDIQAIRDGLPVYFEKYLDENLFCYIIRENHMIVSCAWLLVVEKPMSPAFINGRTGTVLNVYTNPSYRHKGYAKKIMERLVSEAKEMQLCVMELKSTEDGYPLYQSVGFVDDGSKYHFMKWYG